MRYSDIGKDVHGLIGGRTQKWCGNRMGHVAQKEGGRSFGLSAKESEKAREIPLVCFHCMVALAKAPRWERRDIPLCIFVSGPSTGWGIPRVKRWEVNGGLTLWFKQGTRPVSLTHVCRGRCYTSTDEQKRERAKEREGENEGGLENTVYSSTLSFI